MKRILMFLDWKIGLKQSKAERGSINRNSWQSHNLERDKVFEKLEQLDI